MTKSMNKKRKIRLQDVVFRLNKCQEDILDLACEESIAFENTPESLKETEAGEQRENNASTLMDCYDDIGDVIENLETILES